MRITQVEHTTVIFVGCGDEGTASLAIDAARKLTTSYVATFNYTRGNISFVSGRLGMLKLQAVL